MDAADPLASFRRRFSHPDPDLVYLDGNSLGRLPLRSVERAEQMLHREWGERLIRAWNEAWWEAPRRIGDGIGRLIGASPGEVMVADSTSVNLFKLVVAALTASPQRERILTDDLNFPSDVNILQGAVSAGGDRHRLEIVASPDGIHGPHDDLVAALDEDVALITLSHVTFKSGYRYDLAAITAAAHAVGALVLWDLSHSVGAVSIDLSAAGVDLAVGCTYKYLNGGPGAPAFMFVRSDLQDRLTNPLSGWWGHRAPFDFDLDFAPAPDIRRFLTGTAPMLSLGLIEPGVELVLEAGLDRIEAKSRRQSEFLLGRWSEHLAPLGFSLNSPHDPARRGSHISLGHASALGIDLALINDHNVIPDYRPPDNLRLGIAPLYTTYDDLDRAVTAMETIVRRGTHRRYGDRRPAVT